MDVFFILVYVGVLFMLGSPETSRCVKSVPVQPISTFDTVSVANQSSMGTTSNEKSAVMHVLPSMPSKKLRFLTPVTMELKGGIF